MIFYKNKKSHKKTTEQNLVFSIFSDGFSSNEDDSVGESAKAKVFFNLIPRDGALKTGLGFEDLAVPASKTDLKTCHTFKLYNAIDKIEGIWLVRYYNEYFLDYFYMLMIADSNFSLFGVLTLDEYDGSIFSLSSAISSLPTHQCSYRIDDVDCGLFFSEQGMVMINAESTQLFENVPALVSCVVHYDYFFAITNEPRRQLLYSSDLDVRNLTSAEENATIEFLDELGTFTKLVVFNDYVYLFREYGITKISNYSSKSEFSFTHIFSSVSKIFEKSICVCGENIIFATRDGLYAFNGSSVSKVATDNDKLWKKCEHQNCSAATLNGKFYLATFCNFDDGNTVGCESDTCVNNVLFEVDLEDYFVNIYRGVDIMKLLAVDTPYVSKLCACFNTESYQQQVGQLTTDGSTFSDATEKFWTSLKTDLGYSGKRKRMKRLRLQTAYECSVTIDSDEESKTFDFEGASEEQEIPINVCGKNFQFTFRTSNQNCEIKKPVVVFDCVQ